MAKATKAPDATPFDGDALPFVEPPPAAPVTAPDLASVQAELDAARAEIAALRAAAGPSRAPGKRYRVSVKDGPTAVVESKPDEHPADAFRRVCGIISSSNPFEIIETEEPCGHVLFDGTIRPFAA